MKALLVDDEPLVRAHLKHQLQRHGVECSEASDAAEALELAATTNPTVVFLDIQIPGPSGLQLAEALNQLPEPPFIVFVTGYSEHALAAFERGATDYLLKPVSEERLLATLARVRARTLQGNVAVTPLARLAVRTDTGIRLLPLDSILCCLAREKKVFVRTTDGQEYRALTTLTELETRLPAGAFFRVHDSYLIPLAQVVELLFLGNHEYELRLSDGRRVPVGRSRYPELRRRLGL